jgi:N-acetylglucosamine kinase-like BadF-type ATPase
METALFQTDVKRIQCLSAAVLEHIAKEAGRLSPAQRDALLKHLQKGDAKQRSIFSKAVAKLDHILHRFHLRTHDARS